VPSTPLLEIPPAEQAQMRAILRRARYGSLLAFHILLLCAAGRNPTESAAFLCCSRSSVYRRGRAYRAGRLGIPIASDGQRSLAWLPPGPTCRTEAEFEQQLVAQGILSAVVGDDSGGPPVVAVYFLDGSDKQVMLCPGFLVEIMLICKRLRSTSASASITSVALPCVLLRRSKKS